jgi:tetratricopeptide (TPR) repeat protein
VPEELDAVTMKALAKKPEERYQTAEELLDDLRRVRLSMTEDTQRTRRLDPAPKSPNASALTTINEILQQPRVSIARLLAGVSVFLLVIGLVWWIWFRPVAHRPPPDAERWFAMGTNALRDGAYFQASKALEQAIQIDDDYVLAHARLAEAWTELDYTDKAKNELLRVSGPASGRIYLAKPDALYLDAVTATATRDFTRAIKSYEELARLTPNKPEVYVDLGRAYENDEQPKKALESYVKATEIDARYATAFLRIGMLYGRRQELASAEAAFARAEGIYQALGSVEGRAELFFQRGVLLIKVGQIAEAREQLQQALDLSKAASSLPLQIKAMLQLSYVFHNAGDMAQAQRLAGDAVKLAQANGMENLSMLGLVDVGSAYLARGDSSRGDYDEAEKYFTQALDLARRYKARRNEARALLSLGSLRIQQNRPDEALQYLEPALAYYQQINSRKEASLVLLLLGRGRRQKGDYAAALAAFQQQLQLAEEIGDQSQKALSQEGIGNVLMRQERYPEALGYFQQSHSIYKSLGMPRGVGNTLTNQSYILWQLGQRDAARRALDEAQALANQSEGESPVLTDIRLVEAGMALDERRFGDARANAKQVLELIGTKNSSSVVQAKYLLGLAEVFSGAKKEGGLLCREAVEIAARVNDPWLIAKAGLALAEAEFELGNVGVAHAAAIQAQQSFARLGQQESEWRAWLLAARARKRAGDETQAREYASHIPGLLFNLQLKWGDDSYHSYLTRSDVQLLRNILQDEFALSN